jgi:hypothetical protein
MDIPAIIICSLCLCHLFATFVIIFIEVYKKK